MKPLFVFGRLFAYRDDPKPIPTRAARRSLVVVISLALVASVVLTTVVSANFALVAVILVGPIYLWFARSATRNMTWSNFATLPDHRREQVAGARRAAFTLVSSAVLMLGLIATNLAVIFHIEVAPVAFATLAWVLFLAGVYLLPWVPVAILAWQLPDEKRAPVATQSRS